MKFAKISGFPRANDKPNEERALGTRMGSERKPFECQGTVGTDNIRLLT